MENNFPSPDGRYALILTPIEMRMSHTVNAPTLHDQRTGASIFEVYDLWDGGRVTWSPESDRLSMIMRLYPGTKAAVEVDLYPDLKQGKIRSAGPEATLLLEGTFEEMKKFLNDY